MDTASRPGLHGRKGPVRMVAEAAKGKAKATPPPRKTSLSRPKVWRIATSHLHPYSIVYHEKSKFSTPNLTQGTACRVASVHVFATECLVAASYPGRGRGVSGCNCGDGEEGLSERGYGK